MSTGRAQKERVRVHIRWMIRRDMPEVLSAETARDVRALSRQVAHARAHAPYFAEALRDVIPTALTSRDALAALPVTRKSDLSARQKAMAPLGGLNATPVGGLRHIF